MQINKQNIITVFVCLAVGVLLGLLLFRSCSKPVGPIDPVVLHDTVYRDSIHIKEVVKWLSRDYQDSVISHDPVITADSDTISIPDDTIHIPIDHYQYSDSVVTDTIRVTWDIRYSGYKASIDEFKLDYTFTPTTPVVVKKNGWGQFVGVGVSVGYGLGCSSPVRFEPFVGVTVTYGWGYHW